MSLSFFPAIAGHKGQVFQLYGLSNVRISMPGYRNWGPFVEPGIYQTYLIIGIVFLMFDKPDIKRTKLCLGILIFTLITTFSTTGFISIPFILLAYILNSKNTSSAIVKRILLLLLATGVVFWFINSEFFDLVVSNKFDNIEDTGRTPTIIYGLQLWLKRPIFGYSSKFAEPLFELAGFEFGITNTFIGNLISFGAFVGIYSLIGIILYAKSYSKKPLVYICLAIGLIISLSGETYRYSPVITFITFYRFSRTNTQISQRTEKL